MNGLGGGGAAEGGTGNWLIRVSICSAVVTVDLLGITDRSCGVVIVLYSIVLAVSDIHAGGKATKVQILIVLVVMLWFLFLL